MQNASAAPRLAAQLVGAASAAQRNPMAGERSMESESSSQRLCCRGGKGRVVMARSSHGTVAVTAIISTHGSDGVIISWQ